MATETPMILRGLVSSGPMTSGQHELRLPWLIQLLKAFELPLLEYRLADGDVRRISASADPGCPTCASEGQLGLGDLGTPPWTVAPVA